MPDFPSMSIPPSTLPLSVCQSLHVRGMCLTEAWALKWKEILSILSNQLPSQSSFLLQSFRMLMVNLGCCVGAWDKSIHNLSLHRITVTWGCWPSQGAWSNYPLECLRDTVELWCTPRQLPRCSPGTNDHFNNIESVNLAEKFILFSLFNMTRLGNTQKSRVMEASSSH